jgi:putative hydrolase of the HAD superfamily
MPKRRVIFFDVGNTLLFPNRSRVLAPLTAHSHPTLAHWQELERKTKTVFDEQMRDGNIDHGFWWTFHSYLLEELGVSNEALRTTLVENTHKSGNGDQILPGTREALQRLCRQYRIAVISNADGHIAEVLNRCGIADCFETITDSGIVGCEKPHPAIFAAALEAMKARPEDSLYVGDVYSVDYLGARNSGMDAVLFDVSGAYRARPEPRVQSLSELEAWLA